MKIIIFGPQGSGKGTQAELIARRHGWPYISTGDIFRYHLKNQTPLGKQVADFMAQGVLVPDELTNEILENRINQPDCASGFVLDGYPRNQQQADFLNQRQKIDFVISIELSDDQAVSRLADRLACKCGLSYHPQHNPPKAINICDKCGGELFKREDDQPAAILKRLEIFHAETEPIFDIYRGQKIFFAVDGSKGIDDVYRSIDEIISKHKK